MGKYCNKTTCLTSVCIASSFCWVCRAMPIFLHLFRPSEASMLSMKMLTTLLMPCFSETGFNKRQFENEVYAAFTKYLREAASTSSLFCILYFEITFYQLH